MRRNIKAYFIFNVFLYFFSIIETVREALRCSELYLVRSNQCVLKNMHINSK